MTPREQLAEVFPLLHSLCYWEGATEICGMLAEEAGSLVITESTLRMALKNPADHWARWWRDVRRPLAALACTHRADPTRILYAVGYMEELRRAEMHLDLGRFDETQVALKTLRAAQAHLQARWFAAEPRTRDAARIYFVPVLANQDWNWRHGEAPNW